MQRGDHLPAEPVEELAVGDAARAGGLAFLRVDEHEVDVGGHVELAAAQLAHADHDEQVLRFLAAFRARSPVDLHERRGVAQRGGGR